MGYVQTTENDNGYRTHSRFPGFRFAHIPSTGSWWTGNGTPPPQQNGGRCRIRRSDHDITRNIYMSRAINLLYLFRYQIRGGFCQYISIPMKYTVSGSTLQYNVGLTLSFLCLISREVGAIQKGNTYNNISINREWKGRFLAKISFFLPHLLTWQFTNLLQWFFPVGRKVWSFCTI